MTVVLKAILASIGHKPLILLAAFLVFSSYYSILITQWIMTGSLGDSLKWMRNHVSSLFVSMLAAMPIPLFFAAMTNRYWPGFTVGFFLCFIVAKADQVKYETALTHFIWSDLFKTSDPGKFKELIGHYIRPAFFLPLILGLVLGNALVYFLTGFLFLSGQASLPSRGLAIMASIGIFFVFWRLGSWVQVKTIRRFTRLPELSVSDYDLNVHSYGTWLAFLVHVTLVQKDQDEPDNYLASEAERIQQVLKSYAGQSNETTDKIKPTILVLAVESLWDITRIKGLDYAKDPLQALRSDYVGDVQASCFAGLTANSEFEFLTGMTLQTMHDSACPFIKIKQPIPAIPAQLRQLGYHTSAIHSYTRSFYDRDRVYPLLGFDSFIGLEELTAAGQVRNKGWYMADEALFEPIVRQLNQTRDPQLIYTLTMQNHGPYVPQRYLADEMEPDATPVFADTLPLSEWDRLAVSQYTQGVRDAANLYDKVCRHIENLDQPIILLAFGDHLPGIGEQSGYQIMVDSGMAASVKDPILYQVPVFFHANQAAKTAGLPDTLKLKPGKTGLWPHFNLLGIRLLKAAGLPLKPYQQLILDLDETRDSMDLTNTKNTLNASGEDLSKVYEWLQYDWLWGAGHTLQR